MANEKAGSAYGEASKEEHRRSGYYSPDSHYEVPERPDLDLSTTKPDATHPEAGNKRKPAPAENKARRPVTETKARKSTRKRK